MREICTFEYAVIRLVPSVEREEFLNVGVVVYCQSQDFLRSAFVLEESRLHAFAKDLKISEVAEHLRAFERVCAGGDEGGPIGKLTIGARFRWLTAPRSTILQTSPVHTGLSFDANETIDRLVQKLVR